MAGNYVAGVECGKNHSGNDRLSGLDVGYYQCCGCRTHYSPEAVHAAQSGPVSGEKGNGGVIKVRDLRPQAEEVA